MVAADMHPSIADLAAFTLGTLDDAALAAVEAHVADCPTCQERAAESTGDNLVDVLRRVHASALRQTDTVTQTYTPRPVSADADAATRSYYGVPVELAQHDRYRVVRLLGEGGMGCVYEAEHRVMQRPVALKVINSAYTSRPAAVERFRREVRAAARLAHPNIVTTYDAEDAGNTLFLVMEYVKGVSLARLVKERGPLPVAEACDYVRQAALGLQHAHERGMVHRDVKPDNLMLVASPVASAHGTASPVASAPGVVKVLDFGLAELTAERGRNLTEANVVMGTPDYMAPEQAEAPHGADIRADVYSLGCTFYYLLTGKVPFPAPTSLLKIIAHREQSLPEIAKARPEVPPELARILARLLAKKPEDRYQTPGEVAAALEPFARPAPISPLRKRRPLLASVLAAALLASVVLAGGVVYRIQTDKGELVITTLNDDVEVVIKQGGKQIDMIDTKTTKSIRLRSGAYDLELKDAPEGLKLDITNVTLMRDKTVLAKIERVTKEAAPADPSAAKIIQPLQRIPFSGGSRFSAVDVTQDGRSFLAARLDVDKVRVWDTQTGKLTCEIDGYVGRFTPDGGHVIASRATGDMGVHELPTGKVVQRFGSPDPCWNFFLSTAGTKLHKVTPNNHEIYDWASGKRLCRIPWRENIRAFLAHDGQYLLRQPNEKAPLQVLDTATGKEVDAFRQLREVGLLSGMSADGNRLFCHEDWPYKIFDTATGKQVAEIQYGAGSALSGNGRLFLTSTMQRDHYGVWDVDSGRLLALLQFSAPFEGLYEVHVSRDGRYAVCAGPGDFVYVFRLPDPPPTASGVRPLGGPADGKHGNRSSFLARIIEPSLYFHPDVSRFSADGKYLCMLDNVEDNPKTKVIRVWDAETGKLVRAFADVDSPATGATFTPDGKQLLACHLDGTFRLWNLATGGQQQARQFARPKGYHTTLWCFSPDGKHVATSEAVSQGMRHFRVWEYETGRERVTAVPLAPDSWQHYCRFTPDGNSLVTLDTCDIAATDGYSQIRLHDLESGKWAQTVKVQGWIGKTAGFRDDGRQVGVGRYRSAGGLGFEFFDLANGKSAGYIALGVKEADDFRMTPDGRFGVCATEDRAVRFFDLRSGKEVCRLPTEVREGGRVWILVSPDSRRVAVGRADGAGGVSLFRLPDPPAKNKP